MSLLAKYKKSSAVDALMERVGKLTEPKGSPKEEADFWYPSVDKTGNGLAIVRFLPPPGEEKDAVVLRFTHAFQGPTGQWYIEHSRTTLGERDPVSELNSKLWNQGDQDTARKQKRKQEFFSNVYVIKDKEHPENEGKVFVFKYGKKIFDKLNRAMNPPEGLEDEKLNPFDLYNGADFKIIIKTVDKYRNYDDSKFAAPSVFLDGDEEAMEAALQNLHSLEEFVAESKFKSYDDLKARLMAVCDEDEPPFDVDPQPVSSTKKKPSSVKAKPTDDDEESEDDEILARLKREIEGYTD